MSLPPNVQAKYGNALGVEMGNTAGIVSLLVTGHLPREEGTPLVQDWECLRVRTVKLPACIKGAVGKGVCVDCSAVPRKAGSIGRRLPVGIVGSCRGD